jgi:hypothetical protein
MTLDETQLTALWDFPFRDAFRSLIETRMLVQVVRRLGSDHPAIDWTKLVSGNVRPEDEGTNTPHRDHLLELYVASAAAASGADVEPGREPDVILRVERRHVGIAAKRLQSHRRVLKNAKKAADQIKASTVERGIIFLDVSNLVNRHAAALRYLQPSSSTHAGTVHRQLIRLVNEHPEFQRLLELPHVEGIVLRHASPALIGELFAPATLETWNPVAEQPSDLTVTVYGRMLDALAPEARQHASIGPSGYAPCEFVYVHSSFGSSAFRSPLVRSQRR